MHNKEQQQTKTTTLTSIWGYFEVFGGCREMPNGPAVAKKERFGMEVACGGAECGGYGAVKSS